LSAGWHQIWRINVLELTTFEKWSTLIEFEGAIMQMDSLFLYIGIISAPVHHPILTTHHLQANLKTHQKSSKPSSTLIFIQNTIIPTASYFKKDGTLCCIVLKFYYLCVVKGEILVTTPIAKRLKV
jgi:hypothetical protein